MQKHNTQSPFAGTKAVAGILLASQITSFAEEAQVEVLDPVSVLATRFVEPLDTSTSSISIFRAEEIERKQQNRLIDALNNTPGVQGFSASGQTGNNGSVLVRGLPTNYSQVIVDGVRVADGTAGVNNFLSNAQTNQVSQVEILRGPQSVLYGAEAAAGVIGLTTQLGEGDPSFSLFGEAGSFDSYRFGAATQGQLDNLQFALELGNSSTANDTTSDFPKQDYDQDSAVLSLKWLASEDLSITFGYRGSDNQLDTRQVGETSESISDINTEIHLLSLNAEYVIHSNLTSQLTLGYYDEAYKGNFDGTFGASFFNTDISRFSLNWSNQWVANDGFTVVAGAEYADTDYEETSTFGSEPRLAGYSNVAVYANAYWNPVENALIEFGSRYDDNEEFGGDIAWNIGGSYELTESGTRLRARVAESFRTPTLLDSESFVSSFSTQLANPDLVTEEILGFEVGFDQELCENHALQVTYFYQTIENAVTTESISSFPDPSVNQRVNSEGDSRVSGFETALQGGFSDRLVNYRLAWTAQLKDEVIDVPDHIVDLDVYYDAGKWILGFGTSYIDGASYGPSDNVSFVATDERFVTRLYGHYEVNENLKLHGRIENLFDEEYLLSDIFGTQIQGQGFGAFAGLTLDF